MKATLRGFVKKNDLPRIKPRSAHDLVRSVLFLEVYRYIDILRGYIGTMTINIQPKNVDSVEVTYDDWSVRSTKVSQKLSHFELRRPTGARNSSLGTREAFLFEIKTTLSRFREEVFCHLKYF